MNPKTRNLKQNKSTFLDEDDDDGSEQKKKEAS